MSMNLHCDQIELWQTPSYISYMCFSNEDGGWQGILYRYKEWVRGTLSGCWVNNEALEVAKQNVLCHCADLDEAAAKGPLTFSVY